MSTASPAAYIVSFLPLDRCARGIFQGYSSAKIPVVPAHAECAVQPTAAPAHADSGVKPTAVSVHADSGAKPSAVSVNAYSALSPARRDRPKARLEQHRHQQHRAAPASGPKRIWPCAENDLHIPPPALFMLAVTTLPQRNLSRETDKDTSPRKRRSLMGSQRSSCNQLVLHVPLHSFVPAESPEASLASFLSSDR